MQCDYCVRKFLEAAASEKVALRAYVALARLCLDETRRACRQK
ncbi:hypothetical protein OH491_19175 [Termitidicoccus mucosus]